MKMLNARVNLNPCAKPNTPKTNEYTFAPETQPPHNACKSCPLLSARIRTFIVSNQHFVHCTLGNNTVMQKTLCPSRRETATGVCKPLAPTKPYCCIACWSDTAQTFNNTWNQTNLNLCVAKLWGNHGNAYDNCRANMHVRFAHVDRNMFRNAIATPACL